MRSVLDRRHPQCSLVTEHGYLDVELDEGYAQYEHKGNQLGGETPSFQFWDLKRL